MEDLTRLRETIDNNVNNSLSKIVQSKAIISDICKCVTFKPHYPTALNTSKLEIEQFFIMQAISMLIVLSHTSPQGKGNSCSHGCSRWFYINIFDSYVIHFSFQSVTSPLQSLQQRTWLIHWSLFVFFNHPKGRDNIIELFLYQPQ